MFFPLHTLVGVWKSMILLRIWQPSISAIWNDNKRRSVSEETVKWFKAISFTYRFLQTRSRIIHRAWFSLHLLVANSWWSLSNACHACTFVSAKKERGTCMNMYTFQVGFILSWMCFIGSDKKIWVKVSRILNRSYSILRYFIYTTVFMR